MTGLWEKKKNLNIHFGWHIFPVLIADLKSKQDSEEKPSLFQQNL